ncbi:hypothetical protein KOR34_53070 [Posidoniimonas corsicana]|uniref:DNA-binding protein n=1 Tax=Posidoniimonas corsicana TaxID=1938618 RepID=A0A5C5USW9_9BACT|nr:hypothetical protein [Posidoniimonas corsicana]TWT29168.1 hypothetical protein KOR34_53070 [Posidoniimonas corsicana]
MKTQRRAKPQPAGVIEPATLYTLPEFKRAAGLGDTSIRNARLAGVVLKTLCVGRRKYVRGSDGIAYIENLAHLAAAATSPQEQD